MRTVITPDALARSKFGKCTLQEWADKNFKPAEGFDGDELFYFRYPSPILENEMNGDGDLMEVIDWTKDLSSIDIDVGGGHTKTVKLEPGTTLYYR